MWKRPLGLALDNDSESVVIDQIGTKTGRDTDDAFSSRIRADTELSDGSEWLKHAVGKLVSPLSPSATSSFFRGVVGLANEGQVRSDRVLVAQFDESDNVGAALEGGKNLDRYRYVSEYSIGWRQLRKPLAVCTPPLVP